MRPDRRWLFRAAAVVASVAIVLGVVEIALRLVGFSYPLFPEKLEFGSPGPKTLERLYVPDRELFWVRSDYEEQLRRAEGVDLVFMGCSCTELARYDEYLVEQATEGRPGQGISFLNAGTSGWTTHQGLHQLERDIVALRPKVVTLYFGWNDHWIGFGIEDRRVALMNDSLLYSLRGSRLVQLVDRALLGLGGGERDAFPPRVSLPDFTSNLREMVRVARANEIVPVLMTAPTSHRAGREPGYLASRWVRDLDQIVPLHQRYAEAVRRVAAEEDAILCDLEAAFESIPRTRRQREHFMFDGIHLVDAGQRVLARKLHDCLAEHALLEPLLRPERETVALAGRVLSEEEAPGERTSLPRDHPTELEIKKARLGPAGKLTLLGWTRSPKVVDDIVVFIDDRNMGAARHPMSGRRFERAEPADAGGWRGFLLTRPTGLDPQREHAFRVDVYSDDELLASESGRFGPEAPGADRRPISE